ncbi:MAG: chorismate-binding protein [bacterium]|nr:chorismate-binding protein [bacterium]
MMLTVRFARDGGLLGFERPRELFIARDTDAAREALDAADRARRDGAWIAGSVAYDLGASFVREPPRASDIPLVALGAYDAPNEQALPDLAPVALSPLLSLVTAERYARAIASIREAIARGDVYQVNYTTPFAFALDGDPYALWCAVARTTHARYQAYAFDGERHVLSWSPELFLAFDGARVETRPMKGTAPLDAPERLDDAKNRAEHVMIVDLLRNDLHRVCDDVRVERLCERERYPTFHTMTSTIAGTLHDDASLRAIFEAAFPCGSVTGAPKRAAIAAIAALEAQPRGAYCGTLGYLSPQRRGWWNVAIRTAVVDARGAGRFDAGGGIVCDSDADDEAREVLLKARFLRDAATPFELWETFASDAPPSVLDAHLARLAASAARMGIAYDAAALLDACRERGERRDLVRVRVRADGSFVLRREPLAESAEPVRVCLSSARVASDDPFLAIKSSWRPSHDRATAEARARDCFDALLQNERGELTEGARSTLVLDLDGTLVTPPRSCGLLPGILRSRIVTDGTAVERTITRDDLARARTIYVGNSARGLLAATLVE